MIASGAAYVAAVRFVAAMTALALTGCDGLLLLRGFAEPKVVVHGTLPIELSYREGKGGIVILSGRVNGKADVDFVLDTGAPVTVLLDNERTAALGLDTSKARRLGPSDDPAAPTGVVQTGVSLTLGAISLTDVTAIVLPENSLACPERYRALGFAGVIGADLLRRFVVEVDPPAKRVTLHEPATWKIPTGGVVVPLTFDGGHPFVSAKLTLPSGDSIEMPMHLDTGMSSALSLTADSDPALPMPAEGETTKSCFVGGLRDVREGPPVNLKLAGARFSGVRPSYSVKGQGPAIQERGAIGSGLLARRAYALDYANKRLVVTAAER